MGLRLTEFFDSGSYEQADTEIIVCHECSAHLCLSGLVASDQFWGSSGEAYLVDGLINISCERKERETSMRTGRYVIDNVRCSQCRTRVGWQYKKAFRYSEAYKEGKYVIEKKFIRRIPNLSSTARLLEQAKVSKRRRSSASVASNTTDDDFIINGFRRRTVSGIYDYSALAPMKVESDSDSVLTFIDVPSYLQAHNGHQTAVKSEIEEELVSHPSFGM